MFLANVFDLYATIDRTIKTTAAVAAIEALRGHRPTGKSSDTPSGRRGSDRNIHE